MRGTWVVLALAAVSGCVPAPGFLGAAPAPLAAAAGAAESMDASSCAHPHPCGGEWPPDLVGPFPLRERLHLPVVAHDGIVLDGYVWIPDVPADVKVPVVFNAQPYAGQCAVPYAIGYLPSCMWAIDHASFVESTFWRTHRFDELLRSGFAVAVYSVRGTGSSGGCFDLLGPDETRDQAAIVSRLANESWSNGRVGMWGLSYTGTTPWEGAIEAPSALKAIVAAGSVPNFYFAIATPQGATATVSGAYFGGYTYALGVAPPAGAWVKDYLAWEARTAEGPCVETVRAMTAALDAQATDDRYAAFFEARRLTARFGEITSAVFVVHGFREDRSQTFQDDVVWNALPAAVPRRMLVGQWDHTVMFDERLVGHPDGSNFTATLLSWFDYWLKGRGPQPRLGVADHQDTSGVWHASTSWPPADAQERALYMHGRTLDPAPGTGASSFVAATSSNWAPDCNPTSYAPLATSHDFITGPLAGPVRIAGNPFVYLLLESGLPGGTVGVDLYRMPVGYECSSDGSNGTVPTGLERLATGGADLRFHDGGYEGADFPVGAPTVVRVDLTATSAVLGAGERLALVLTGAGWWSGASAPYEPVLTVHAGAAGSHLVLPVAEGSLGADLRAVDYPTRPFSS